MKPGARCGKLDVEGIDVRYTLENSGMTVEALFSDGNVEAIFLPLLRRLAALREQKGRRVLALLAAPPGAGKSTLAAFLEKLSRETPGLTPLTAIGMDGFHRRQAYLLAHTTLRDGEAIPLVKIKGAPETFDLEKLRRAVARVAAGEDCGWPRYDRTLHNPVEDALRVTGEIVLLEGNYLLLDEDGWRELRALADYAISIEADLECLRGRLVARHIETGKAPEEAAAFVEGSDLPNARLCLARSMPADLRLRLMPDGGFETHDGRGA